MIKQIVEVILFNHIINLLPYNKLPEIGEDDRYHTVYIIEFVTGHYYIGKRSTKNYEKDEYFASGSLPNYLKNRNIIFERKIMFFLKSSKHAVSVETEILENKQIYNNDLCLNLYPGSPPSALGSIIISKGDKFKMINPKSKELYLEQGWKLGGVKRVWINKDDVVKFILPKFIDKFISEGWEFGNPKSKNRVFIIKNEKYKYISKKDLPFYIENGWERRHNVTGRIVIEKNSTFKFIFPEDLEKYLQLGYVKSNTVANLTYIFKDGKYKRVKSEKLNEYILDGWSLGNNTTDSIYINNGIKERRIHKCDLMNLDVEWHIGRLKKIYLNNGIKERRLYESNIEDINNLLSNGYRLGKLDRKLIK